MSIHNKQILISSSLALLTISILALTLKFTSAHDTGSCTSHAHDNDVHSHSHTHQCDNGHHHHHHHETRRKLPEELAEEEDLKLGFDSYYYDHDDHDIQDLTGLGLWVNAMGCSLLVSLASLICLIILPLIFVQGKPSKTIVDALAVFGAGAMLGDAFLHQLPHAFGGDKSHSHDHQSDHGHHVHSENGHSHSHSIEDLSVGLSILAGIVLFLLVEKAVRYVDDMCGEANAQSHGHHHHHRKSSKKLKDDKDAAGDLQVSSVIKKGGSIPNVSPEGTNEDKISDDCSNGEPQSGTAVLRKRNITTGGAEEQSKMDDIKDINNNAESTDDQKLAESPSNLVFGYLNLFSDGVHNFTDGMALGSAFLLYGSVGGWSRTLFLLAHELPQEAQYVSSDPGYLGCKKKECKKRDKGGACVVTTCSASLEFHVINIRTDIEFVFFSGGFVTPCILKRSTPRAFANPKAPLYGHLSSIDSTGNSMRVTWVSGDKSPQQVQYGNGKSQTSTATTFSQDDMCSSVPESPAKDFGWHDPGYIHSAVMTGLEPSTTFSYRYGSNSAGWSNITKFKTPPAGGSDQVKFLAFGDMGKAPRDPSLEHYIQPGSISVVNALESELSSGNIDSIFHIGDISYATGFLVEWDFFLHLISPLASQLSYMTAIGNHERDYIGTGSVYITADSGGECGVPYETYFPMPTSKKDKPWYSIEQGSVHFTVISTEHDWSESSEQYGWMKKDMASVDRTTTPWLIFMGHRPMYSTPGDGLILIPSVDTDFVQAVEPLLLSNKVDLALFGHVHNYERTCAVYGGECKAMPKKDGNGVDTYDNTNYKAPVHAIIGMAGFKLDSFSSTADSWSLKRISEFGHVRVHATKTDLNFEYVNANTRKVDDRFHITRSQGKQGR